MDIVKAEPKMEEDEVVTTTIQAATKKALNVEDLVELKPHQQPKRKYPPGCPVWYNFDNPSTKVGRPSDYCTCCFCRLLLLRLSLVGRLSCCVEIVTS